MRLTFADVQRNVAEIANRTFYNRDVIFELLAAYGRATAAITKLRSGDLNLAQDTTNEVLQRGVVYFKHIPDGNLRSAIDSLDQDPLVVRYNPRYLIATDYDQLVAKDTKKDTTLDIKLRDIDRNVDFFYGWTGDEVTSEKTEAVADRRAADKMKDLYAEIERVNRGKLVDPKSMFRHDLNVFFSRLLFCFFAEDTKVFSKEDPNIFTDSIKDFTQTDGSDLDIYLSKLFDSLDTEDKTGFTSPFSRFPYVNGSIFDSKKHSIAIPKFNAQARKLILDCGNQNWAAINPDIFGSMFQSIVDEEHRATHGMHYTSVPNIMKTIEPLFIDELREEFDRYYNDPKRLNNLWYRISKIKVFDPACGSGNFLIIAYKELRKIEHGIIDRLFSDDYKRAMLNGKLESKIKLDNFYGIELDDFAHEIAILSLYLAKHQMNIEFEQHFGKEIVLIPLTDNARIIQGNAARLDWQEVCPNVQQTIESTRLNQQVLLEVDQVLPQESLISEKVWEEIYLIGNPPYQGARLQDSEQKHDIHIAYGNDVFSRNLDYISIWFIKGARYISGTRARLAFVSTNSICQGEHTALLWPDLYKLGVEIGFAYTSFKWANSARGQAGVYCIIVSLRMSLPEKKRLFSGYVAYEVENINAYLSPSNSNVILERRSRPLSSLSDVCFGSMANDGGHLIFTAQDYTELTNGYPQSKKYFKKFIGAEEFINGTYRWVLWLDKDNVHEAKNIPEISERMKLVAENRRKSKRSATAKLAKLPYRFGEVRHTGKSSVIIPKLSSERREYIPMGYVDGDTVISDRAFMVPNAPIWVFGILSSKTHMVWTRAVAGRLKIDINYSTTIVYNNFPVPLLSDLQTREVTDAARAVLFARENHTERTLGEMYDPDKMPFDLREAHHNLDRVVDRLYRLKPYRNDEERLVDLFSLYEQMIAAEKDRTK